MRAFFFFLVTIFFYRVNANNLNIIRDAETENFLKEISLTLVKDNNLELDNLKFFVDNKDFINAFVIPGQKIFITKGLIMKSKQTEDIAGVIAHEIGHILGGHFSNKIKTMEKASMISIISSILAAGAMLQELVMPQEPPVRWSASWCCWLLIFLTIARIIS